MLMYKGYGKQNEIRDGKKESGLFCYLRYYTHEVVECT